MASKLDAYRGCLLGLAVGDAMGMPVDDMRWEAIEENYGPRGLLGYNPGSDFAEITSYTQVCAYICNALLLSVSRGNGDNKLDFVKLGLKEWTRSQQFARDPERSFCWVAKLPGLRRRHCRDARMLDTLRLWVSGIPQPSVNQYNTPGSLTSAIAVGMFFHEKRMSPMQVGELAAQIVSLTHGDPHAFLSAAVLAYAITGILNEPALPLAEQFRSAISVMFHQFRERYPEAKTVAATLSAAVERAQGAEPMDEVMEALNCYSAMDCLAGAIYAALANEGDFDTAMITAVNHSGYSSAVASIAGAILGAKMGDSELPDFYLESLEVVKPLRQLADDMVSFTPTKGLFDDDWDQKYVQGIPLGM